jgi:hypothetical protein
MKKFFIFPLVVAVMVMTLAVGFDSAEAADRIGPFLKNGVLTSRPPAEDGLISHLTPAVRLCRSWRHSMLFPRVH